jgi:hypothetical protein
MELIEFVIPPLVELLGDRRRCVQKLMADLISKPRSTKAKSVEQNLIKFPSISRHSDESGKQDRRSSSSVSPSPSPSPKREAPSHLSGHTDHTQSLIASKSP